MMDKIANSQYSYTGYLSSLADAQSGGWPWWAWLLLVLAVILIVYLIWWWLKQSGKKEELTQQPEQLAEKFTPQPAPPVVDTAPTEPAQPTPVVPDDLVIIEGIGPKIASVLQAAGIATFAQLAETDITHINQILKDAGLRLADPSTWSAQARLAAGGQWDELKALQDSLKGGRQA